MNKKQFLGTIEFAIEVGATPWSDPSMLTTDIEGVAFDYTDKEERFQVATIRLALVQVQEAQRLGFSLFDVFDAYTQDLHFLYQALFDDEGDLRGDIRGGMLIDDVLYIDEMHVEPTETDVALRLVEAAGALFVPNGLITAVERVLELTPDEMERLGFRRLGNSGFVYSEREGPSASDSNGKKRVID